MVGELTDRVAVITGGASGIGEACARIFAARGATVAIADLNLERANVVAKEIGGLGFEVDVADAAALEQLAEQVENELGPTEIVVTSAGIAQRPLPPEAFRQDVWDKV